MILEIENAENYYIVPYDNADVLMYVGDRKMMNSLAHLIKEGDLIATTGINLDRCYLIMNWTQEVAEKKIAKAKKKIRDSSKELEQWQKEHPPEVINYDIRDAHKEADQDI